MLYFNDCIFIHIPKTGGTSLCYYVLESVFKEDYLRDQGHLLSTKAGWKHATLRGIYKRKKKLDLDPNKVKYVIAMFRNPYDKMVSLYHFYKQTLAQLLRRDNPKQYEITKLPFHEWVVALKKFDLAYTWRSYEHFIELPDGNLPQNLIILRYENYEKDVREALKLFGGKVDDSAEIKHLMKSNRPRNWRELYDKESEEAVYQFHKWVFNKGYYERMIVR